VKAHRHILGDQKWAGHLGSAVGLKVGPDTASVG
jgi:hypothetical protein